MSIIDDQIQVLTEQRKAEKELADVHTANVKAITAKLKKFEAEKNRQAKRAEAILNGIK